MSEKFDWPRIHKWEENIEREVTDAVYEQIFEWFGVEDLEDITEEQMDEVRAYRDSLNEYSPMQIGFSNIIMSHEDLVYYKENE